MSDENEQCKGKKYDKGKAPINLIPSEFTEEIARVLAFGASRYDAWNWSRGLDWSRCLSALVRHVNAWERGEDIDQESGLHHMAHAATNAMFLYISQLYGLGRDDRWRRPKTDQGDNQEKRKPQIQDTQLLKSCTQKPKGLSSVLTRVMRSLDYHCAEEFGITLGVLGKGSKKS